VDYDAPAESRAQVDTSAAAIAAAALFLLGGLTADPVKGLLYDSAARHILGTLCTQYLGKPDPEWEGILKGGVYHIHKKLGVNESVMWANTFSSKRWMRRWGKSRVDVDGAGYLLIARAGRRLSIRPRKTRPGAGTYRAGPGAPA